MLFIFSFDDKFMFQKGQMDGRKDERTDTWTDRRTELKRGHMDGQTNISNFRAASLQKKSLEILPSYLIAQCGTLPQFSAGRPDL